MMLWQRCLRCLQPFFYVFDGPALDARLPTLLELTPFFVAFSVLICYAFKLTTTKWRFISLPDAINILRVATVLTGAMLVLDYILVSPNQFGAFFFGKLTIILYWFLQVSFFCTLRFTYRYYRYSRARYHARADTASPALLIGRAADIEVLLRGIESGAIKKVWPVGVLSPSLADQGQLIRNVPVIGSIDDLDDVVRDFSNRGKPIARVVMAPSALDPGSASRIRSDAGAQARPCRQSIAGTRSWRFAAPDAGCRRGFAAAAKRKDRLRQA